VYRNLPSRWPANLFLLPNRRVRRPSRAPNPARAPSRNRPGRKARQILVADGIRGLVGTIAGREVANKGGADSKGGVDNQGGADMRGNGRPSRGMHEAVEVAGNARRGR
jgi:hypothetical protein